MDIRTIYVPTSGNGASGGSSGGGPRVLARGAGATVTGVTVEGILNTVTIPVGSLTAGDVLRVRAWYMRPAAATANGNIRLKFGGTQVLGSTFTSTLTTAAMDLDVILHTLDGSGLGQRTFGCSYRDTPVVGLSNTPAINITAAGVLTIESAVTPGVTTDSVTGYWTVELYRAPT